MVEVRSIRVDGKTFLWNGEACATDEEASAAEKGYRAQGFDVQRVSEAGVVLLFTRRPLSSSEPT